MIWANSQQNLQNDYAPNEDSDQAGHLRCLHEEALAPSIRKNKVIYSNLIRVEVNKPWVLGCH